MLRLTLLVSVFFCCLFSTKSEAANRFGLGIVLFDPTGLSGNYYYERDKSLAAGLGWSKNSFHLNVDHLWYHRGLIVIDRTGLDVQLGLGLRIIEWDRHKEDEHSLGLRLPIGVSHHFRSIPLQLFGELAPALILIDSSHFVIDLAIGGRYYF